jgi:poly(hydroxyalkanoate) depolymerase family esterase
MNPHYQALMRAATQLTRVGQLREATDLIQRALSSHKTADARTVNTPSVSILDSAGIEIEPVPETTLRSSAVEQAEGKFIDGRHSHAGLSRDYKLFLPPNRPANFSADCDAERKRPLVVMLHGCTQNANDFALGTDMNGHARRQGFVVLYPEQSSQANPSRCWNWFKHNHQRRGSGEPALLASMTLAAIQEYDLDAQRVYIAGLSAGGAMAAIMAELYPDIFAAVGVHSGLAAGAASNVSEALAAMKKGGARPRTAHKAGVDLKLAPTRPVATIVFHGDRDSTVHPDNGHQVLQAVVASASNGRVLSDSAPTPNPVRIEKGTSSGGRNYTRTTHSDHSGETRAEHWLVHGAGHAWSGGQKAGSFTDPIGPDATGEMLRFFLAQPPLITH